MDNLFNPATESQDDHWISISDLMAGLMIIFLFIAISLIIEITEKPKEIKQNIIADLENEFDNELNNPKAKWRIELDGLTFRLRDLEALEGEEPRIFFETGSAVIMENFEEDLHEFIPRYVEILNKHKDDIIEVRIEGHTSSVHEECKKRGDIPYFCNMVLSLNRARTVLEFVLQEANIEGKDKEWLQGKLTANGYSSSQLICKDLNKDDKRIISSDCQEFGGEDKGASQRVEFEVRINSRNDY